MTVYSFDKEFAVETKKSVNIGGQVQTINFTDNYIKKLNKAEIAVSGILNDLPDDDDGNMSAKEQAKLADNIMDKLTKTAIDWLNKLLDGRGQELYNFYGHNTYALLNIITFLTGLSKDVIKDRKVANKSK